MRLLSRFGDDVARRHLDELAVDAGEWHFDHASQGGLQTFQPRLALAGGVDLEATELRFARRLPATELDTAVGEQVEHGDALGHPSRVVELWRRQNDAVAEADPLRALATGGQEDLRRRRVAVLLEEVVFDLPDVLEPQRVGQLDLFEGIVQQAMFGAVSPGSTHLMLVEDTELHGPM